MKSFLLCGLFILMSCSKTKVALEDKAPNIRLGEKLEAYHAGVLVERATTEEELLKAIEQIEDNHSSNFNWNDFYGKLNSMDTLKGFRPSTIKKLVSLNETSCRSMDGHEEFYKLLNKKFTDLEILNYSLSIAKCPRFLPANILVKHVAVNDAGLNAKTFLLLQEAKSQFIKTEELWNSLEDSAASSKLMANLINLNCKSLESNDALFSYLIRSSGKVKFNLSDILPELNADCFATVSKPIVLDYLKLLPKAQFLSFLQFVNSCQSCFDGISAKDINDPFFKLATPSDRALLSEGKRTFIKLNDAKYLLKLYSLASESLDNLDIINSSSRLNGEIDQNDLKKVISNMLIHFQGDSKYPHLEVVNFLMTYRKDIKTVSWEAISRNTIFVNSLLKSLYENNQQFKDFYLVLTEEFKRLHVSLQSEKVFLHKQFTDEKGTLTAFAKKVIETYGMSETLNLLSLSSPEDLLVWRDNTNIQHLNTAKLLGELAQQEILRLKTLENAQEESGVLLLAYDALTSLDPIFDLIHKFDIEKKPETLKLVLSYKELVIEAFENYFSKHSQYFNFLNLRKNSSLDAHLLLMRHEYRSLIASNGNRPYDMKSDYEESFLEVLQNGDRKNSVYYRTLSEFSKMWLYSDHTSFTLANKTFCDLLNKSLTPVTSASTALPGCYEWKSETAVVQNINWSFYSYVRTMGQDFKFSGKSLLAGIIDASNITPAKQVDPIKAQAKDHATILPLIFYFKIPNTQDNFGNYFNYTNKDEKITLSQANIVYFKYLFVDMPETPKLALKPKIGSEGAKILITTTSEMHPRLISFGSDGEIRAPSQAGGKGAQVMYPVPQFQNNIPQMSDEDTEQGMTQVLAHDWTAATTKDFFTKLLHHVSDQGLLEANIQIDFESTKISNYCKNGFGIKDAHQCADLVKELVKSQFINHVLDLKQNLFDPSSDPKRLLGLSFTTEGQITLFRDELTIEDAQNSPEYPENGERGHSGKISLNNNLLRSKE